MRLILIFIILILITGCVEVIEISEELPEEKPHVEKPAAVEGVECCIGCGYNECILEECPYECCENGFYQIKECPENGRCLNNKCTWSVEPDTFVYVYPEKVEAGDYIYITLVPGKEGSNERIDIYGPRDQRLIAVYARCYGGGYTCYDKTKVPFKTYSNWELGLYHVEVIDLATGLHAKANFKIIKEESLVGYIIKIKKILKEL